MGLRANLPQFLLLLAVNAFVGALVGLERTVVPLLAGEAFGIASAAAVASFLVAFGPAKAIGNLFAGRLSERVGRRRVLIAGWLLGLPVPFIVIVAPDWGWVVAANVLLGLNQGLAWSMTVNMKIDLVGPQRRGLALGLNESAGYVAVGVMAMVAGAVAEGTGLRPEPFYLGIAVAAAGTALSVLFVRDTAPHVASEIRLTGAPQAEAIRPPPLQQAFLNGTLRRPDLQALAQAGFMSNANDALVWALMPIVLLSRGLDLPAVAVVAAAYPLSWGVAQIPAGWLSDRIGRYPLIVAGMLLQGAAIAAFMPDLGFAGGLAAALMLGVGTALTYPTIMAAISDRAGPVARATYLGVYRFWRDIGTMAGALAAGVLADALGMGFAIGALAVATAASGVVVAVQLPRDELRVPWRYVSDR
ncbi:MAG: MFS transporter [Chloroflexota bacterium]|nr:MFS transporter [Chloroflexota bacterium]